jgi:hypothetical protein
MNYSEAKLPHSGELTIHSEGLMPYFKENHGSLKQIYESFDYRG